MGFKRHDFLLHKKAEMHIQADLNLVKGVGSFLDFRILRGYIDNSEFHLNGHKSILITSNGNLKY